MASYKETWDALTSTTLCRGLNLLAEETNFQSSTPLTRTGIKEFRSEVQI